MYNLRLLLGLPRINKAPHMKNCVFTNQDEDNYDISIDVCIYQVPALWTPCIIPSLSQICKGGSIMAICKRKPRHAKVKQLAEGHNITYTWSDTLMLTTVMYGLHKGCRRPLRPNSPHQGVASPSSYFSLASSFTFTTCVYLWRALLQWLRT